MTMALKERHNVMLVNLDSISSVIPPSGLRNTILSSLEDSKRTLVPHFQQTAQCQFKYHVALEGDKVADILKNKELWSVVVTVAEVTNNKRVLEL